MPKLNAARIFLVAIFLFVAVVGYVVVQQRQSQQPPPVVSIEKDTGENLSTQEILTVPSSVIPAPIPESIEAQEYEVLSAIRAVSTGEEIAQLWEALRAVAKENQTLEFVGCVGNPIVLSMPNDSKFTVKNSGTEAITLLVASREYTISAGSEQELIAGFERGGGLYGYGCRSASATFGGMIIVTESG